jgi:general secretion pathway protein M
MESLKNAWSNVVAAFGRLNERERRLVLFAGIALAAFLLFLVTFSFINSAQGYRTRIAAKQTKLGEAQQLAESYDQAQAKRLEAERSLSANQVSLTSYLEEVGNEAGVQIPAMNPKPDAPLGDGNIIESSVEVRPTSPSATSTISSPAPSAGPAW